MRRSWVSLSVVFLSCALGVMPSALAISLSSARFVTIDAPGATGTFSETSTWGINSAGQIVGTFSYTPLPFDNYSFLRTSEGIFTTINAPGATGTWAYGINNAGRIVGDFLGADRKTHGFVTAR